jgi:hypothetical protein
MSMNFRQIFNMEGRRTLRMMRFALLGAATVSFGLLAMPSAHAEDMNNGWDGWPKQSRAERLGTFTYVYGGAGFASHSSTEEGKSSVDKGYARIINDETVPALEDADDMVVSGGFGVRFPSDWNFEFGLTLLNGAYEQPDASGSPNQQPNQPVFEMSVLKGFKLGGPPLLRYTLRAGFASIDDSHTDDGGFFGIGVAHEPFRVELRQYDFGVFESQVLQVSYIYDF